MSARYTYLATDLLSGRVLGELPLHGVSFDRQLNKASNWQGSGNLDNDMLSNDDMLAATAPGRTSVYVYREDQIVWGGIIWSRTYQSQAKSLQMTAQSFESYAYKRIYRPSTTIKYEKAQCWLINELWRSLQSDQLHSDIGVRILDPESLPSNDVVRQLTVNPWDMKSYGEIIDDPLMNFQDSAEWTIECFEEQGVPQKQLLLGYPRLGIPVEFTPIVIDYPGNILNYYWSESASQSANAVWATGDGDQAALTTGYANNQASLDVGYPLLEAHESHQGVTKQDTIDDHAKKDLVDAAVPRLSKTIQIKADEQPEFGTYPIGSDAKMQILDTRFPDGFEGTVRVLGWSVTPSSSEAVEEISLIIEGSDDVAVG